MKNIPSSNNVLDVEISGETHHIKFERDVQSVKINGQEYYTSGEIGKYLHSIRRLVALGAVFTAICLVAVAYGNSKLHGHEDQLIKLVERTEEVHLMKNRAYSHMINTGYIWSRPELGWVKIKGFDANITANKDAMD